MNSGSRLTFSGLPDSAAYSVFMSLIDGYDSVSNLAKRRGVNLSVRTWLPFASSIVNAIANPVSATGAVMAANVDGHRDIARERSLDAAGRQDVARLRLGRLHVLEPEQVAVEAEVRRPLLHRLGHQLGAVDVDAGAGADHVARVRRGREAERNSDAVLPVRRRPPQRAR